MGITSVVKSIAVLEVRGHVHSLPAHVWDNNTSLVVLGLNFELVHIGLIDD